MVDHRNVAALAEVPDDGLVLVTCWPLDEALPGGPERLLVMARPCADDCDEPAYRVIR